MARAFRGEVRQRVDGKGRVSIPASFRRVLESCDPDWQPGERDATLIVVFGDDRRKHLECFSVTAMEAVEDKIRRMPNGKVKKYLSHVYSTLSWETTVDASGRIVLPKNIRDKIGLTDGVEAVFAGTIDTFEIWHPDAYDTAKSFADDDVFTELGLDPDTDPSDLLDMEF